MLFFLAHASFPPNLAIFTCFSDFSFCSAPSQRPKVAEASCSFLDKLEGRKRRDKVRSFFAPFNPFPVCIQPLSWSRSASPAFPLSICCSQGFRTPPVSNPFFCPSDLAKFLASSLNSFSPDVDPRTSPPARHTASCSSLDFIPSARQRISTSRRVQGSPPSLRKKALRACSLADCLFLPDVARTKYRIRQGFFSLDMDSSLPFYGPSLGDCWVWCFIVRLF